MTPEQVNETLMHYKEMIGRCGHIDVEVRRLRLQIERAKARFERDIAGPSVSHVTGQPRGSGMGRPTEQTALSLANGEAFEKSAYGVEARMCEKRIAALNAEQEEKRLRIDCVACWLAGLPEREKWIIERHLIEREIWYDIIPQFNSRFSDDVTRDRLKRMQKQALERIYAMAA